MYCVKCGVRLDDSLDRCPLCGTPVWRPDAQTPDSPASYSRLYPVRNHAARIADAAVLTVLLAIAALISLIYCLRNYGAAAWSGYVMLGIATAYVIFVLPLWLRHPNPVVLIPIAHAAIGGYLLYISCRTGVGWFLSFAFPLVCLSALLLTGCTALFRYVRGRRLYITGGALLAIGGFSMLMEFFAHLTFGTPMFHWSLYVVSGCGLAGIFFVLSGFIRPLHAWMERKFFV